MAVVAAVATGVVGDTISETKDLTVSGFGTVEAAIIFVSGASAVGNPPGYLQYGIGFWDGTNQVAMGWSSTDAVTTTIGRRSQNDGVIITLPVTGATVDIQIEATISNITDGIRLTVTDDNTGVERYVSAILIKGLTNAYAGVYTGNGTTSDQDVTAPGFKPNAVFYITMGGGSTDGLYGGCISSFGFAKNDATDTVTQMCLALSSDQGVTTSNTDTYINDGQIGAIYSGGSLAYTENIKDFDSSGFTLNFVGSGSTGRRFYLALQCPNPDDFDIGLFDLATSTGNSAVTGLGFEPQVLFLQGGMHTSYDSVSAGLAANWSMTDGTNTRGFTLLDQNAVSTSNTDCEMTSNMVNLDTDDGTAEAIATLTSLDSDGFTLNYSDAASSARKWMYFAIGDSTAGGVTANPHNPFGHPFLGAFGGPI